MNLKKAYTLVEMVVVLVIISLVFSALGFISWSYISKLNLQNDKETIESSFSYLLSSSLSQIKIAGNNELDYVGIKLKSNSEDIYYIGYTGEDLNSSPYILEKKNLNYTHIDSEFKVYSGDSLLETYSGEAYFVFKSYNLGSLFIKKDSGGTTIFTGNKLIKYSISNGGKYKKCFKFLLSSGRLFPLNCKDL